MSDACWEYSREQWDPGSRAHRSLSGHAATFPPLTEGQLMGTSLSRPDEELWHHIMRRLHLTALFPSNESGFQDCDGPSAMAMHI